MRSTCLRRPESDRMQLVSDLWAPVGAYGRRGVKMRFFILATLSLLCVLHGLSNRAVAVIVVDFEAYAHGETIDNQYFVSDELTISARNFKSGPNLAIIFDSRKTGTADLDLEDAWTGGNLRGSTALGNLLILAENDIDANNDGFVDSPDDQGSPDTSAGELRFKFTSVLTSFGLDLIDVDGPDEGAVGFFGFRLGGTELARVRFDAFVNPSSTFYDPTFAYGDRFANRIKPITTADLGIAGFDEVVVNTGLCSAVDGVRYEAVVIPEPSAAAIAGAGFIAAMFARGKRRGKQRDDRIQKSQRAAPLLEVAHE